MTAMAAMASALVKAGLVDAAKVEDASRQQAEAQAAYEQLSQDIAALIRKKRPLRDLQDMAFRAGKDKDAQDSKQFFARVTPYVEIAPMNLASKVNQNMVQKMLQDRIDELEAKLNPLLAKSRKMEQKWGFERGRQR